MTSGLRDRRLTLTTPSLGVQQWHDDIAGGTTIAWVTTGGRGLPATVILLPVLPIKGNEWRTRWKAADAVMQRLGADASEFWRGDGAILRQDLRPDPHLAHSKDDPKDPAAPRALHVDDGCATRWGAHHLLVLLVYDEAPSIGWPDSGAASILDGRRRADADHAVVYAAELENLNRFFGQGYEQRLVMRGLVRLPRSGSTHPPDTVTFALASCQSPADITDAAPNDHQGLDAPSSASLFRLSKLLIPITAESPSLLVLTGDQVYTDATAGLFDARLLDDRLQVAYENLLTNPGAQSVFGLLPVAMMLDDHEIADNWEPGIEIAGLEEGEGLREAKRAYWRFQRMAGPPPCHDDALWYEFTHSGIPFFVADTRTERRTPDGGPRRIDNWRQARIIGETQWHALRNFLLKHRDRASFVVAAAMLLPRALGLARQPSLALEQDSWDAFPSSMHELLAFLCDNNLTHVVFLSGDAHLSSVARVTVSRETDRVTLWSVHSSGLYSPYPFANDTRDNYAWPEIFHFQQPDGRDGRRYRCEVESVEWFPGDGFSTLRLTGCARGGHELTVRFHRAGDVQNAAAIRF